jgi:hypothetical protein
VVTADGCEIITKFPAEELLVAGPRYWAAGLNTPLRESQSHLNTAAGRGEARASDSSASGNSASDNSASGNGAGETQ